MAATSESSVVWTTVLGLVRTFRLSVGPVIPSSLHPLTLGCQFSFPSTRVSSPPKTTFMTKHGLIPSN